MVELVKFVPSYTHLRSLFPSPGDDLHEHRLMVKTYLLSRDERCIGCGDRWGNPEMHEGLISRRDAMGWNKSLRVLIMTPYNCFLLDAACNKGFDGKHAPSRDEAFAYLTKHYDGNEVLRWLQSLPFKDHPLKGWFSY